MQPVTTSNGNGHRPVEQLAVPALVSPADLRTQVRAEVAEALAAARPSRIRQVATGIAIMWLAAALVAAAVGAIPLY